MRMSGKTDLVAILGQGYAVPDTVRTNDDPIFDWIKKHAPSGTDLFNGLKYRRVLGTPDGVIDLMVASCRQSLQHARLKADDVDMIIGSGSVSDYVAPNNLAVVHHRLGLSSACRVLALNSDYTIFQDGVRLANDLVRCGTARHVLVTCGNNWTHHMDYHEPVSLSAGDGAGAVLIGPTHDRHLFRLVDWDNETQSHWYGCFRMAARPTSADHGGDGKHSFTTPLMKLDDKTGEKAFKEFGLKAPGVIVPRMLARHGLTGQDITLITHQVSKMVQDAWQAAIQPKHYVNTLEDFANMVSSSVPVNFAKCHAEIHTRHLVLVGIGMEAHATALLLERD
jgi:3-oxoacyl-[acyl-carrier-protein] synthase-3